MSEDPHPSDPVGKLLGWICDLSGVLGGVILVAMAGMTVVSVIGRAFFDHPILGDVELVQLGCAVVVAAFLPYAQFKRANIIVDFFTTGASARAQRRMDAFGTFLYTVVMALLSWRVAVGGIDIHAAGESSMLMNLPLWIPYALMVPGFVLCTLIGAYQTLQQLGNAPQAGA